MQEGEGLCRRASGDAGALIRMNPDPHSHVCAGPGGVAGTPSRHGRVYQEGPASGLGP